MSELLFCRESTNIETLEYFRESRRLIAAFRNGGSYQYDEVPESYWLQLRVEKERVGRLFNQMIVRQKFAYLKLAEYKPDPEAEVVNPPTTDQRICRQCGSGAIVQGVCASCGFGARRGSPSPRRARFLASRQK